MSKALIGRCGLYCGACGIYRVYVDNKTQARKKMAEFFKCKAEQIRCQGCQNLTNIDWCFGCKILECLERNRLHYCYECNEIKNCAIYQELNKRYEGMPFKNLERLKQIGEDQWFGEQIEKWRCPNCTAVIQYEQKKCGQCGHELF